MPGPMAARSDGSVAWPPLDSDQCRVLGHIGGIWIRPLRLPAATAIILGSDLYRPSLIECSMAVPTDHPFWRPPTPGIRSSGQIQDKDKTQTWLRKHSWQQRDSRAQPLARLLDNCRATGVPIG
jgi:hypothetical protein